MDIEKVKVVAVNYLNAKPLIKGIVQHDVLNEIILTTAYPAKAAQQLIDEQADVGLVPVATIPSISNANIVGDFGIAANGNVASVCIFSHVPVSEFTHIYLDYQSKTSVKLAQLIMKLHFKQNIVYLPADENYIQNIRGTVAGVIIGDRAMQQLNNFKYVIDLATEWKNLTGLPFIFAAWISNKQLPESFIAKFNAANQLGLSYIDHVIAENPCDYYDLKRYYTENIQFKLDSNAQKGLALFLQYLEEYKNELQ
jgi:chorismate dehydratase